LCGRFVFSFRSSTTSGHNEEYKGPNNGDKQHTSHNWPNNQGKIFNTPGTLNSTDFSFPFFCAQATKEWEGEICAVKRSRGIEDLALIIGPVVGGMLFIAIVGAFVFLVMARRRRRSEGKYKPATQEQTSPRLQLDNMIKPPPEERLI
jgi:hypothetical protein